MNLLTFTRCGRSRGFLLQSFLSRCCFRVLRGSEAGPLESFVVVCMVACYLDIGKGAPRLAKARSACTSQPLHAGLVVQMLSRKRSFELANRIQR